MRKIIRQTWKLVACVIRIAYYLNCSTEKRGFMIIHGEERKDVTEVACQECGKLFFGLSYRVRSGRTKYCSRPCASSAVLKARIAKGWTGKNNPNWKGGISKNHYHYKKIQMERYPERVRARALVNDAIKAGKLKRLPCHECGAAESHAHHEDYSRPLKVKWLCRPCHRKHHGGTH